MASAFNCSFTKRGLRFERNPRLTLEFVKVCAICGQAVLWLTFSAVELGTLAIHMKLYRMGLKPLLSLYFLNPTIKSGQVVH